MGIGSLTLSSFASPLQVLSRWLALLAALRHPKTGYVLLFEEAHALRERNETDFDTLLDILDEASQAWAADEVPFWAFIALPDEEFPDLQ